MEDSVFANNDDEDDGVITGNSQERKSDYAYHKSNLKENSILHNSKPKFRSNANMENNDKCFLTRHQDHLRRNNDDNNISEDNSHDCLFGSNICSESNRKVNCKTIEYIEHVKPSELHGVAPSKYEQMTMHAPLVTNIATLCCSTSDRINNNDKYTNINNNNSNDRRSSENSKSINSETNQIQVNKDDNCTITDREHTSSITAKTFGNNSSSTCEDNEQQTNTTFLSSTSNRESNTNNLNRHKRKKRKVWDGLMQRCEQNDEKRSDDSTQWKNNDVDTFGAAFANSAVRGREHTTLSKFKEREDSTGQELLLHNHLNNEQVRKQEENLSNSLTGQTNIIHDRPLVPSIGNHENFSNYDNIYNTNSNNSLQSNHKRSTHRRHGCRNVINDTAKDNSYHVNHSSSFSADKKMSAESNKSKISVTETKLSFPNLHNKEIYDDCPYYYYQRCTNECKKENNNDDDDDDDDDDAKKENNNNFNNNCNKDDDMQLSSFAHLHSSSEQEQEEESPSSAPSSFFGCYKAHIIDDDDNDDNDDDDNNNNNNSGCDSSKNNSLCYNNKDNNNYINKSNRDFIGLARLHDNNKGKNKDNSEDHDSEFSESDLVSSDSIVDENGHTAEERNFIDEFGFVIDEEAKAKDEKYRQAINDREVARREVKWANMAADWEYTNTKMFAKLKERCRKGIPARFRGVAWQLLLHSWHQMNLPSNAGVYVALREKTLSDKEVDATIARDRARTFPNHVLFKDEDGVGQRFLCNVLHAYAASDPEVGYVQGMAFLVAALSTQMGEEECFWALHEMMYNKRFNMREMYKPGFPLLHQFFYQLKRLIRRLLPRLGERFEKLEVDPSFYASQWFLTLFVYHFEFRSLLRIWDIFFCEGWKIIFRTGIALMRWEEERLLSLPFDELLPALKNLQDGKNLKEVIRRAHRVKFKTSLLNKYALEYQRYARLAHQNNGDVFKTTQYDYFEKLKDKLRPSWMN